MEKWTKNKLYAILLVIIMSLLMVMSVTYAATGTGQLGVGAYYSKSVGPQEGDTFVIDYRNQDTGEVGRITIDASEFVGQYQIQELKYGYYEVTKLNYTGTNETILKEGFGTKRTFAISDDNDDLLRIRIGKSEVSSLDALYNNAFIIDEEHDEHGKRVVFYDEGGRPYRIDKEDGEVGYEYIDTTDPSEDSTTSTDPVSGDIYGGDVFDKEGEASQPSGGQKPVTEYYQEVDPPRFGGDHADISTGTILIILAVITLAGCGIIYWLHKKGKF